MVQVHNQVTDVRDLLLADVAIQIQLSPSNYRLAVQRVDTLSAWLDRDGSPLAGRVRLVYPQGSMAINATIASCLRNDEFDIDVIAQFDLPPGTTPQRALDLLYIAVKGERSSRYYAVTHRNTRCITVDYTDMHVDLTPAELIPGREPRVSYIFHHRPEEPTLPGKRIIANPYGFAEWFNANTPRAATFEEFYEARSRSADSALVKADTEEVPEQIPAYLKPPAVVALQLIKRNRNVRYDPRAGRRPPSVMLACLIAQSGSSSARPFDELLHHARGLKRYFEEHQVANALVHIVNPTCPEDVFSDRWPDNLTEQGTYLGDLRFLVSQLERLERGADLETISDVFSQLFGEEPSLTVIRKFVDRSGQSIDRGTLRTERGSGRVHLAGSGLIAAATSSNARSSPGHTFYGPGDDGSGRK